MEIYTPRSFISEDSSILVPKTIVLFGNKVLTFRKVDTQLVCIAPIGKVADVSIKNIRNSAQYCGNISNKVDLRLNVLVNR